MVESYFLKGNKSMPMKGSLKTHAYYLLLPAVTGERGVLIGAGINTDTTTCKGNVYVRLQASTISSFGREVPRSGVPGIKKLGLVPKMTRHRHGPIILAIADTHSASPSGPSASSREGGATNFSEINQVYKLREGKSALLLMSWGCSIGYYSLA